MHEAAGAQARRVARTFVWCRPGPHDVVGYFALTAHSIRRHTLPGALGHGAPSEVPAVLLARLALDRSLQGRGWGEVLLAAAVARVVAATALVAARVLVVDAIDESAAAFYERYGFRRTGAGLRLAQKISSVPVGRSVAKLDWHGGTPLRIVRNRVPPCQ